MEPTPHFETIPDDEESPDILTRPGLKKKGSQTNRQAARKNATSVNNRRLSLASIAVDRGNKGYLDDLEKTIRAYDANGDGNYDVEEVFQIVKDLEEQRRKRFCLKKTLLGFIVVSAVLLCAVFGLMWTTLILTRQMVVRGDTLVSESTGRAISVKTKENLFVLQPVPESQRRQRRLATTTSTCELDTADAVGTIEQTAFEIEWAQVASNGVDEVKIQLIGRNGQKTLDLSNAILTPFVVGDWERYAGLRVKDRTTGVVGTDWYHIDCPTDPTSSEDCYWYKGSFPIDAAMVSGVTDDSAVIGFRTEYPAQINVEWSAFADFSSTTLGVAPDGSSTVLTSASEDCTGQFEVSSFGNADVVYYRFIIDGAIYDDGKVYIEKKEDGDTLQEYTFQFKPLPSDENAEFSFVVFSDAANAKLSARTENSYLFGGNEYAGADRYFAMQIGDFDHSDPGLKEEDASGNPVANDADTALLNMRNMHLNLRSSQWEQGNRLVRGVLSRMAFFHVWDDHDYCWNDADGSCPLKSEALQAFQEYYRGPNYAASDGIYHKFSVGAAEFFMLDTRSYRSDTTLPDDSSKSMLGATQKTWLFEELAQSTKQWIFIVSTVTSSTSARPGNDDHWISYQTEAAEIKAEIVSLGLEKRVFIISGDLHSGGAFDDGTNTRFCVPEMGTAHTNLEAGNTNSLGTWSDYLMDGSSKGYSVITVKPGSVTFEAYNQHGDLLSDDADSTKLAQITMTETLKNGVARTDTCTGSAPAASPAASSPTSSGGRTFCTSRTEAFRWKDTASAVKCSNGELPGGSYRLGANSYSISDFVGTGEGVPSPWLKIWTCSAAGTRVIQTNNVPNHDIDKYTDTDLCAQYYKWTLPLNPTMLPDGSEIESAVSLGISLKGPIIYDAKESDGLNAILGQEIVDEGGNAPRDAAYWHGHPSPQEVWHYHSPEIGYETFPSIDTVIGYAFDGYPIFPPLADDSVLDECNFNTATGSGYHVRTKDQVGATTATDYCKASGDPANNWNYIIGCYRADPNLSIQEIDDDAKIDPVGCTLEFSHGSDDEQ